MKILLIFLFLIAVLFVSHLLVVGTVYTFNLDASYTMTENNSGVVTVIAIVIMGTIMYIQELRKKKKD